MPDVLHLDDASAMSFIKPHEIDYMEPAVKSAHDQLHSKRGAGSDFLGWVEWPYRYDRDEFSRIEKAADRIRATSDALVVIGIGGSYIGARAAISMLTHSFFNQLPPQKRQAPEVYFAGHHMSAAYIAHLFDVLEEKDVSVNVISKSGTTTEPAIAFRLFRAYMEEKYGVQGARRRIYVTTDRSKGALKQLADSAGYDTFVIPDDIGGRFSVLTPVGLLPMAVAGINIGAVMEGARAAAQRYENPSLGANACYRYAALRHILYRKGKTIELLVHYEPAMRDFAEWWKQLFGESEGKDGKGIFPAAAGFTTDLHSLGQYIQEGRRHLFETVLHVRDAGEHIRIEHDAENADKLNYLAGETVGFVNRKAYEGTVFAHTDGGVPNIALELPHLTPHVFGQLVYFFEKACGISGYLLGVNPFDQPGVEAYKKNMFALLGKPGYAEKRDALQKRLRQE